MKEGNVQELFSQTAQRCGDRVAAAHLGRSVTYAELEEWSNKLANFLLSRGASKGTVVAILSDDSIAITTAIIGILKANCVFVPLEPAMPDNRLKAMITGAAPEWFLVDSKYSHRLADIAPPSEVAQARVVQLDGAQASNPYPAHLKHLGDYAAYDVTRKPPATSGPDDVCYLYFTSGSTGRPKAIAGRLKGIDHFIRWEIKTLGLGAGVRVSQLIAPTFDAFLRDIFVPLCAGGTICVPPSRDTVFDGGELVRWVDERRINLIHCVPSLFRSMLNEELRPEQFSSLKYVLLSGEPLLPSDVRKWTDVYGDRTRLINLYGPSETTMTKFFYFVEPSDTDAPFIPIGKPMEGAKALVVGENGKACRAGKVGEIYIRTPFRALGYYRQPELTKEVFVQNPFGSDPEDIVYKTGDLGRLLADGNFEFLGRKDQQVKIRGVRIEPKEIENLLRTHEAVKDVAVVDREDTPGDRYLCAYLVLGVKVEFGVLRDFLSSHLPALMIPSAFVEMESLPRTFSGKCDRNALPAPARARRARTDSFVAPRTATEETVAAIWKQVLGVEQVGVNDDFFDLGGHSLIITKVLARVGRAFQVELPLRTLFEVTTVAALAARIETLRNAGRESNVPPLLPVAPEEKDYALSFAQQRLWFFDQLEPGSTFYNLPLAARFSIHVDAELLRRSLNEIVRRHESLRTGFRVVDGLPVQVIAPSLALDVPVEDLRGLPADEKEARARRLGREEAERPFDLTRAPLIRARLLRLGDEDDVVLVTMHHIVSDNWSINIFLQEMSALYEAFSEGRPSPLPELSVQYADFAHWQRRWLQGEVEESQLAYWKEQLAGAPSSLELPTDHPRPAAQTFRGGRQELVLPKDLSDALASLGRREGVSLFMLLLTVFNVLLSRYTGQSDICVGTPTAGRNRLEVESLIGFFVNTLVIRTDLSGDPSFRELLARVRETCLSAYANQDVPFEKLVEELQPERSMSRVPLFQVMFVFQNAQTQGVESSGVARKVSLLEERKTTFDLTLGLAESPEGLVGLLDYSADLYEAESIERMLEHLRVLLGAVASDPSQRLSELPLLADEERRYLLRECNDTAAELPTLTLPQLFARQVEQTPDALALLYKEERLTYSELNARADRLARRLRSLGVGAESLVGVMMRRSTEMVAALLGVLKAGAAYVPLDANLPAERLSYMIEDAGVEVLLTGGSLGDVGSAANGVRVVGVEAEEIEGESGEEFEGEVNGQNIAYVIYTSGSTGKPKGVMISHQAVCNTLLWRKRTFSLSEGDRILQNIPFTFDPSVWQIFGALISGATLVLVEPEGHQDGAHLVEQLAREEITITDFAPSMLQVVLEQKGLEDCRKLRCVFSGGEALPVNLPPRFYARLNADLYNQYGPTETAIDAAYWRCESESPRRTIPIGRPIANKQIYLLDSHLQPVPVGVFGELHIGGMGLARGYLRNPALTAEKFIPNPFAGQAGERLYRTGDLARFLPGGEIEFHGRMDNQVKIRGHRIELGEIEAALGKHHALRESAIAVREDTPGEKKLVAYFVPADAAHTPSVNELRSYLKARLPEYMLPLNFVVMDNLPRTSSGKVNREALPAPDDARPALERELVVAGTPVEEVLCGIWGELLGLRQVGIHDNFFELGGHSLLATRAISRTREVFSVEIPLRKIFESPTVAELAADVETLIKRQHGVEVTAIKPVSRKGELPLSFAQQRLWFLDRLHPNTSAYNISLAVRLKGRLKLAALKQTLDEIVRRHEVLRTSFTAADEQPVAVIHPPLSLPVPVDDLSHLAADALEAEVSARAAEEAQLPFDLTRSPLLRAGILKLGEEEHVTLLTMHHIASDGWSMGVLLREVAALYEAYTRERPSPLVELPIQYADYAVWQREWMRGEILETQVAYWRQRLEGAPPLLELPTDRPRPLVYSYRGAVELLHLPAELSTSLKGLSQRQGVTLFMTLLAAFQVLLARYTRQDDVLVGTPVAGRGRAELEGLIGFFVNTLVLRTDLSGDPSFVELLRRVRDVALGAYTHQDVPFERLVEELQPERDLGWHPLFQVMMVMQNAPMGALELPDLTLSLLPGERGTAKFDLTLSLLETGEGVVGSLEYSTDLFEAETIKRMLGHYQRLLEGVAANPQRHLSELELLTTVERERVLGRWNETRAARDETSLPALFERQVERTPDAPAVEFAGRQLSYRELNRRANQLAHHLRSAGVGADARVGVCVERGLEMAIAVLGVLKAGGAYVPLDPAYPSERLSFMLADAECAVLLTGERVAASLPQTGARVLCLDRDWRRVAGESGADLRARIVPEGLAYVIYTSGSTGRPKGVAMTHRALNNLICWQLAELPDPARTLQFASLSFDVSFQEMFSTWCSGGTLLLVDDELRRDANSMLRFLSEQRVERIFLPFVYLQHLAEAHADGGSSPGDLREVITAGERLEITPQIAHLCERLQCRLHNHYGPSETHVVTAHTLGKATGGWPALPPIGRPIANTQIYILDGSLQPSPIGVAGELCIGGTNVPRGYLGRPGLTAEKFIPNPFGDERGARIYRTGDLARYLSDGRIEFLGRIDTQVKVRGFRIELGEVESILNQHPQVRQSVVVVREDERGAQRLVAYVIAQEATVSVGEMRNFVAGKLPEYMVPSAFVVVDKFPLTPSGKIDRRALPAPGHARDDSRGAYVAPHDHLELQLVHLWEEILDIRPVGTTDNFFELGGHSFITLRLMGQIKKRFGQDVPLASFFRGPTIRQLASILRGRNDEVSQTPLVIIQPAGSRLPFFCVHEVTGSVLRYTNLALQLGADQPFYALQTPRFEGGREPYQAVEEMASDYLKAVRDVQPEGPYQLGGWSFGGIVAFEMAQQLEKAGHEVALLAMFDAAAPSPAGTEERAPDEITLLVGLTRLNNVMLSEELLRQLDPQARVRYVLEQLRLAGGAASVGLDESQLQSMLEGARINLRARARYVPRPYPKRITLFRSEEALPHDAADSRFQAFQDPMLGWGGLSHEPVEVYPIPGNHFTLFVEPHVQVLANRLKACLQESQVCDLSQL
jgi:amino acid adenylation domain-containing protein